MTLQVGKPLYVSISDEVLCDALGEALQYAAGDWSDSQEYEFYRILARRFVYASWVQLQRPADKQTVMAFIWDSVKKLRRMQKWPDWDTPNSQTVDKRTREPMNPQFGSFTVGAYRTNDQGRRIRCYLPNPAKLVSEAERIRATPVKFDETEQEEER